MKKYVVKQHDIRDCGACCLSSIIQYYGGFVPLEKIKLDTRTDNKGTSAYNIINAAKRYGFQAFGAKIDSINNITLFPAIAHIVQENGVNHFVIILNKNKRYVNLMDPAKGMIKEKIDIFLNKWTNIILLFKPIQTLPQYQKNNFVLSLFTHFILVNKKTFIKLFIVSLLLTTISILTGYYYKFILDRFSYYSYNVLYYTSLFFIFTILKIFSVFIRNKYEITINKNIDNQIFLPFIHHIFHLPLDVIKNKTTGEILTRFQELNQVKTIFTQVILSLTIEVVLSILALFALFQISTILSLSLLILVFIYVLYGLLTSPLIHKRINDNIDSETSFNALLGENIAALSTINNLQLSDKVETDLRISFDSHLHNSVSLESFMNIDSTIKNTIYELGLFIISSIGIFLVLNNSIPFINFITFQTILFYFINPFINLIQVLPRILMVKLYLDKTNEFMSIKELDTGNIEQFYPGDINISNLTYSYDDYHNLLDNINLNIKEKEHILLKGKSGIGKSTVCKLLCKDITDYKGTITINNVNINDYSIKTIKNNICYISQNEVLFSDSIYNNICLGDYYPITYINEICKICKIDMILDKKAFRLNSILLDGGINLSGGERQRIILARAIIKKPSILILDEGLSEVDSLLEEQILDNISNFLSNSTIIYVSHHSNIKGFRNIEIKE